MALDRRKGDAGLLWKCVSENILGCSREEVELWVASGGKFKGDERRLLLYICRIASRSDINNIYRVSLDTGI
jgi:hypothetical protein